MKQRYRIKLTIPATGTVATIIKLFPNALTFVAQLSEDQLAYQDYANLFLSPFNIAIFLEKVEK